MVIRPATYNDIEAINDIYNQSIPSQVSTADMEPVPLDDRIAWFHQHNPEKYPVFVAEKDGKVIGWISLSAYRQGRLALQFTAEVSYYIHADCQRQGIASQLLQFVITNAYKYKVRNMFAILLDTNIASKKLLEQFNFRQWGHMPHVADFNGRECGHLYYGLRIK